MTANKSRSFPIVITCIIIMIIIYLFASVEQPYVSCSRSTTNDFGVRVVEEINTTTEKITKRFDSINKVELETEEVKKITTEEE